MDLGKCFDLLDHDLILKAVRRKVADGSILALLCCHASLRELSLTQYKGNSIFD